MFSKDTYIQRRQELKKLVKSGVVLIFGNNNSPCNFPNNGYYPFRQDSSFLYYFGQQRDGLVGVIDIDNDIETLIGDDIDIEDIVWYGSVESVHDLAEQVGIHNTAPMKSLKTICNDAMSKKRKIHFLPPYRYDIKLQIFDLLGIHPNQQKEEASMELIQAVVKMRSTKTPEEIEELERAAVIGYKMHTTAMKLTRPGVTEKFVGGQVDGIANSYGAMVSFPTIFTQHGEIMHGNLLRQSGARDGHGRGVHLVSDDRCALQLLYLLLRLGGSHLHHGVHEVEAGCLLLLVGMDAQQVHDLDLDVVAVGRQEVDAAMLAQGVGHDGAQGLHRSRVGHAYLRGHVGHGVDGAEPYDILDVDVVADKGLLIVVDIDHTDQSVALLSVTLPSIKLKNQLLYVQQSYVHRPS